MRKLFFSGMEGQAYQEFWGCDLNKDSLPSSSLACGLPSPAFKALRWAKKLLIITNYLPVLMYISCFDVHQLGWCQDNGNRSNQESKFDFLATRENWRGTTKNKNHPHQPTIKFTRCLPINFLPLLAPPYQVTRVASGQ